MIDPKELEHRIIEGFGYWKIIFKYKYDWIKKDWIENPEY